MATYGKQGFAPPQQSSFSSGNDGSYYNDKLAYTYLLGDLMQKMSLALLYGQLEAYELLVGQLFVRLKPYLDDAFKDEVRKIGIDPVTGCISAMQPGTNRATQNVAFRLDCALSDLMARKGFTPQKHRSLDVR